MLSLLLVPFSPPLLVCFFLRALCVLCVKPAFDFDVEIDSNQMLSDLIREL